MILVVFLYRPTMDTFTKPLMILAHSQYKGDLKMGSELSFYQKAAAKLGVDWGNNNLQLAQYTDDHGIVIRPDENMGRFNEIPDTPFNRLAEGGKHKAIHAHIYYTYDKDRSFLADVRKCSSSERQAIGHTDAEARHALNVNGNSQEGIDRNRAY